MTEVIRSKPTNSEELAERKPPFESMVWIPGGTFRMGSEDFYPEERPVHEVTVDGFWMDSSVVTNAQFTRFVQETGYVTVAEHPLKPEDFPGAPAENLVPGALVFHKTRGAAAADDRHRHEPHRHSRYPTEGGVYKSKRVNESKSARVEKCKSNRRESMIMNATTLNDLSPAEACAIAKGGLSGVATVVNASSVGRMGNVRRSLRQPEEKKL